MDIDKLWGVYIYIGHLYPNLQPTAQRPSMMTWLSTDDVPD